MNLSSGVNVVTDVFPSAGHESSTDRRGEACADLSGARLPSATLTRAEVAAQIVESLEVGSGVHRLTIPAGISGAQAIRALNEHFRANLPQYGRDIIYQEEVNPFRYFDRTDLSEPWTVLIHSMVPGTTDLSRVDQARILRGRGMAFANPLEVVLVSGAYACAHGGKSLTEGVSVRCDSERLVVKPHPLYGLMTCSYPDDMPFASVGAAGSYLR